MDKEKIKKIIEDLIRKTSFVVDDIYFVEDPDGIFWCNIRSGESGFFIGKNGENLRALNYLVKKTVERFIYPNKNEGEEYEVEKQEKDRNGLNIIVDVNDYQKKKIENLKTVAHMMGERARFFKSSVDVEPMSPFERRIIHEFLSNASDLRTESVGEGENRHIVIKYIPRVEVENDLKI
ncbi:MAG: R3H domain-containing nucleic acid-binding protein [Candidatus Paceibacterota bacterium]|jgi:spoIIIJ-associated protein